MSGKTKKRYFGTDGIRGKVGQSPITPEFVLKLGWATGRVFSEKGQRGTVVIGKDTRISGYMFESALQAGLSSAGADIRLLGPMPTPAIAYLTRTLHAQAGIVISASHNPYFDNGIKFFSGRGTKLPDDTELAIEAEMDKPMQTVDSALLGKAERISDAAGRYIEYCKSTVPTGLELRGLKLVVDCAHGATYHVAPSVFAELGAEVTRIGVSPDGLNINRKCGSTHPDQLKAAVLEEGAHAGIALDGDGDRVIMVDQKGEVVDGDELLYIIAESRRRDGAPQAAVVGTLMSNLGLEIALQKHGTELKRAAVGDRHVMEMLKASGSLLGGESSGHIICLDKTTTGDGIVSALQVLAAMINSGESLNALKMGMEKLPQLMVNVRTEDTFDYRDSPRVSAALRQAEQELGDTGRILLRASGTEPLIRVMVEGTDAGLVKRVAHQLADVVQEAYDEATSA
jgi:phosphoglucosamine mutase